MDKDIEKIISIILLILAERLIARFSNYVFKKYQIRERKLVPLVMILFLLGLFFPVIGTLFMIMEYQDESLTPLSLVCFGSVILIGAGLLIMLVNIIVRKDDIYPVDRASLQKDGVAVTAIKRITKRIRSNVGDKRKIWGWIFSIGGFLLLAACIYLFVAYGPINEPYISPEHEENDMLISICCASVALVGIVLCWSGIRMLNQEKKLPPK